MIEFARKAKMFPTTERIIEMAEEFADSRPDLSEALVLAARACQFSGYLQEHDAQLRQIQCSLQFMQAVTPEGQGQQPTNGALAAWLIGQARELMG